MPQGRNFALIPAVHIRQVQCKNSGVFAQDEIKGGSMKKKSFQSFMVSYPFIIWTIITIIAFVFLFIGINQESIWTDEAFTATIIQHSFTGIIYNTGGDMHPPLYYFLLKLFTIIFGTSEIALRSFSVMGAVATIWLGAGPIRRLFGLKIALIFTGFIIVLPVTLVYSHEVRMYSWAAFFTLSGIIYGYSSVITNRKKDWALFAVFTLAGMYTHNYSLLALFFGFVILFIYILIKAKDRILPYLVTAGCIFLMYLPWFFVLLNQTASVIKGIWIPPVGIPDVLYAFMAPFETKWEFGFSFIFMISAFLLCLSIIAYGIIENIKRKNTEKAKATIFFILIYFLTLCFATLFSIFIVPIMFYRYMSICSGLFLLSVILGIDSLKQLNVQTVLCIILILLILPVDILIQTQKFNGPAREIAEEVKQRMRPDDALIYNSCHSAFPLWYYIPKATHVFLLPSSNSPPALDPKFFQADTLDITGLSELIGKKKRIWIINSINKYNSSESPRINPDVLIQAGYEKKYVINEYDYPFSWLKLSGEYFVMPDN